MKEVKIESYIKCYGKIETEEEIDKQVKRNQEIHKKYFNEKNKIDLPFKSPITGNLFNHYSMSWDTQLLKDDKYKNTLNIIFYNNINKYNNAYDKDSEFYIINDINIEDADIIIDNFCETGKIVIFGEYKLEKKHK